MPSLSSARDTGTLAPREKAAREEAYDIAGGLAGYLEYVESVRADAVAEATAAGCTLVRSGSLIGAANKRAEELRDWARAHNRLLEEEAARQVEHSRARALHEAREAQTEAAVAAYRAWLADGGDASEYRCPPDGRSDFGDLGELCGWGGLKVSNQAPCIQHQAELFIADRDGHDVGHVYAPNYRPEPQHWVIGQDNHCVVPLRLTPSAREAFARKWRDSVQHFRDQAVAVFLPPGQPLCFAVWSDRRVDPAARPLGGGPNYFDLLSGGLVDEPRFEPVKFPWCVPKGGVYLPDPHAVLATSAIERAANAPRDARLVTGIAALDGLFRGGIGIPFGTRVLLTGDPQQCKTHCLLEIGETAAQSGWHVLWISKDDDPTLIDIRRLQRAGLDDERAGELNPDDVAQLSPSLEVEGERALEAAWEEAAQKATDGGRRLLVLVDGMNSDHLSAASDGKSGQTSIEASIGAIIACQRQWPATVVATGQITDKGHPKGTTDLGYKFDVRARLRLSGSTLTFGIEKNKPGKPGTVGTSVSVAVDFMGQRLREATQAAAIEREATLRDKVWAALAGGAATRNSVAKAVGGKRAVVLAFLRECIEAGELIDGGATGLSVAPGGV